MTPPLISVIIPVYNGEKYLSRSLQSVFSQDYTHVEVIVVNDGSTDDSPDICKSFPETHYISQPNQGVAVARNRGIESSTGDYIAFLDQDDCWVPNKLTQQINYLEEHPEMDFVLAKQHVFLEGDTQKPTWLKDTLLDDDHAGYHLGTALIRRRVFDRIGLFDSHYRIGSDSDWFFRAKDADMTMTILPDVLLSKRVHEKNESSHVDKNNKELLKLIRDSLKRKQEHRNTHE